ncbi:MAG: glycerol-3-phosphate 1-O-acyltransferase PlsY [Chloroflexi bacterium]|nr:glycerol-3-phosphate 1-O-acyltransferase PlsY [Chloroflexota bacterium]
MLAESLGPLLLVAVAAYLAGAVPTGLLVGLLFLGVDPRQHGSGKTGATNILRVGGMKASAAVYVLDFLKGLLPVLLARQIAGPGAAEIVAALAALVGHNWSVFVGFTGGRGIATGTGALWGVSLWGGLAAVIVGFATVAVSRYVSLGSLLGTLAGAVVMTYLALTGARPAYFLIYAAAAPALIFFAHRDNIQRLASGTERRLGGPAMPPSGTAGG